MVSKHIVIQRQEGTYFRTMKASEHEERIKLSFSNSARFVLLLK